MNFNSPYNRSGYVEFFRNQFLPEDFDASSESISLSFSPQYTQQVTKIGQSSSLDLNIYEVQHASENDPRVSLSKESFRLLAEYGQKRALVLFVSETSPNYRLSLVTIDLKWEEGKRPTREYSNPKRFSFFLGPDAKVHTPEQYLVDRGRVKNFGDLRDRFSIEVVNKDFFTEIALLFTKLTGGTRKVKSKTIDEGEGCMKLPDTRDETIKKEFAVRLIGRLIFCWFLKKKTSKAKIQLVPDDVLSTEAIKNNKGVGGYYHSVLEPLFFEVLNTPIEDREKNYEKPPWDLIPFLNGGLFTPHEHDFYELADTGYSKHINTLNVPVPWLIELLEIFETYNFTIDENTPVDVELSIEPEMLGRIFENLLAEINPETGDTARKATGSYYTPRSIVEYMVDESLKQYLLTKADITEEKITKLLSYSEEDGSAFTEKQIETLVEALHQVRIIDPACGSGAFPMGILQKIFLMLQKVDPDSKIWLEKMLANIPDPMYRKELKKKKIPKYLHKLGIIKDCIFGVDIQPIAVEISKLRCFLSLIVDENVNDDENNRGIEHLPNLEFKFVCANSLIALPEKHEKGQLTMLEAEEKIDKLKELRDLYLTSYGKEKKDIEKQFRKVQSEMFQHSLDWGGKESQTTKLSQWNPFLDEACSWFDPDWMFGIKEGFDIVIANPPYVFTRKGDFSTDFKNYVKKQYFNLLKREIRSRSKQSGKINLFGLFLMKGLMLTKELNTLTLILPNTILRTTTYDLIRKYVLDKSKISQIVDLGGGVFDEVTAATIIFILQKHQDQRKRDANTVKVLYEINNLNTDFRVNSVDQKTFNHNVSYLFNIYVEGKILNLINKISTCPTKLGKITIDIIEGIVAHKNLIALNKVKSSYPLMEGKNIKRYILERPKKFIIWDKKKIHRPRPDYLWEVENKIVIQRISGGKNPLVAALDGGQHRTFASVNNLVLKQDYEQYYRYILALLNSKALNFYYSNNFSNKSELTVNISKTFLESLPVPEIKEQDLIKLDTLVDKILSLKDSGGYVIDYATKIKEINAYQQQIDRIIYKLYGLTDEEISIVENSGN